MHGFAGSKQATETCIKIYLRSYASLAVKYWWAHFTTLHIMPHLQNVYYVNFYESSTTTGWVKKNRTCLSVDNSAMVSGRKTCDTSKVSECCKE